MNVSRYRSSAAAIAITAILMTPALADAPVRVKSDLPVAKAVERLTEAVTKAGVRVFTVVDYAEGAASVGDTLRPTTLVVFGSPKIGAAAFQAGQTIGLYLPLRVLAYEDAAGDVWLIYEDPAEVAPDHGIPADHPAIRSMQGALSKMTGIAAGG